MNTYTAWKGGTCVRCGGRIEPGQSIRFSQRKDQWSSDEKAVETVRGIIGRVSQ